MRLAVALMGSVLLLAGCQTGPDGTTATRNTGTGAAIGAVIGGVAGAILDKNDVRGVGIGAAAGAAAGAGIGNLFDRQQRDFEQTLEQERADKEIEIERVRDDLLKLTLASEVSFDFDSATINPTFLPTIDKLADVLKKYDRTRVTIVGHTDSSGSESYNDALSIRRAEAVVAALEARGVPGYRMVATGRGEREPRADNATEAGRQLNRRVEILLSPET